jgi:LasA protease
MDNTCACGRGVNKAALFLLLLLLAVGACSRAQDPRPTATEVRSQSSDTPSAVRAEPTAGPVSEAGPGLVPYEAVASGLLDAGSGQEASTVPQVYTVVAGDTLSAIARRFGCDLQALIAANQLADPNALRVGQQLRIPTTEVVAIPSTHLLPNSEFVYGPAYVDFDTAAFVERQGGYLGNYTEWVSGELLSGPQVVDLIAHHYSVGPRLLLAVMELRSGWVTNPNPAGAALGANGSGSGLLSQQLAWAADKLNSGYYDWRGRGIAPLTWPDGTVSHYPPDLNAATAGLYHFFSLYGSRQAWEVLVGEGSGSFLETYRRLFGDPARYAVEPLIPADVVSPELVLPWARGETWFYTGGPHGAWNDGSAWAALDFVPDEGYLGCQAASAWARAAADGLVVYSGVGEVSLDLDGDGYEQTGWVLFYLHLATNGRVAEGTYLKQGDPVGHPSCEGGFSESTHLHFARKYNGEWIAADGPLPMVLSGWRFYSDGRQYDGTAVRGNEEREAAEARNASFNGLVADR